MVMRCRACVPSCRGTGRPTPPKQVGDMPGWRWSTPPNCNGAAYADQGITNPVVFLHVFLTHKHAMFQVRGVVAMATKHRDGRGKRPRSEVNACPWYHVFIDVCMFAGLILSSSAWLPWPDWCLKRAPRDHRRSPMCPPDAIVVSLRLICNRLYTDDSGLHRNWSTGGLREAYPISLWREAAFEHPEGPGVAMKNGRAATQRAASD